MYGKNPRIRVIRKSKIMVFHQHMAGWIFLKAVQNKKNRCKVKGLRHQNQLNFYLPNVLQLLHVVIVNAQ